MSAPMRPNSAPTLPRPEEARDSSVGEVTFQGQANCGKLQLPGKHQSSNANIIPHELLLSLTSTVGSKSGMGHTAHHRHCKGCGIRRPDAVWHHPIGRKKYNYFLEQPTSLTGAGRDISFLCDAVITQKKTTPLPPVTEKNITDKQNMSLPENLIPEEYRMVKNKGIQKLQFYEDAFTVQLKDDDQKLRVLPSLRPSGRMEAVQLMRMMDDMLEKAGVDKPSEELTELSQLEGLLELVKVEQNIYNIVFHELIRQVSVGCAERGQLLAKLRQRYQSLLDRIPLQLKALHTEAVAQRSLDRQLTKEIHRIKTSIQELNMELSKIRDHDAFVSQQAEHAHRQLAESLKQTHTNSDVVQGYHELYELQRARLEAQLLQMTEERDCWSQCTFSLALKVISTKKLQLVSQLHISEQSWFKSAEHCILYITSKSTEDLDIVMGLADIWRQQFTAFMSQLKETEHAKCSQITAIKQGITRWLSFFAAQNKSPEPKYDKHSMEEIHDDLLSWSECESYQGEKQLCCQQTLSELRSIQEKWINMSFQLFRRHFSPGSELPGGHQVLKELDSLLSELLNHLESQVTGENGIHKKITLLIDLMQSWVSRTDAMNGWPENIPVSEWLKLEKALQDCQSLSEEALHHISVIQPENKTDENQLSSETEKVLDKVQEFITNLSNFTEGENQRLHEEVNSLQKAQTRWMLDLLLLMVPDHNEEQTQEELHYMKDISLQTLEDDGQMISKNLDNLSGHITSLCNLIMEEQVTLNFQKDERESGMAECSALQAESVNWVEIYKILLSGVISAQVELSIKQAVLSHNSSDPVCPPGKTGKVAIFDSPVVKLINYDRNITQRKLEESSVHLNGMDALVMSPVTEEAQKAYSDLTTVGLLQQELHDSEVRVKIAEQRALKAEEALHAALEKIQDLERQRRNHPTPDTKSSEENSSAFHTNGDNSNSDKEIS
ncbi:axonemal dynein light chain domain-containing protein 1 [Salarias fasciatus]|uniref:axonemal dynein light chain domain-containing protein 1 n=1 Tax=Salarias fasciatus TaxID=181472 RepID=UPI00117706EA|nr:axonemal dynein light chain domain-containing protein 1 [Salarias fasciatus]